MEKKCPKMCNLCSKLFNVDSLVISIPNKPLFGSGYYSTYNGYHLVA